MKYTRTKFYVIATNIHTKKEYLVCKVVAKGDANNILNMFESQKPEYLTYKIIKL